MDISRLDSDISIGTLEEECPQRINNHGSVVSAYFGSNCFIFDVYTQQLVDLAIDQPSINVFTARCQIAEPEADGAELDEPAQQEPDRSFCRCKSSCKTKQKNEGGRGCPCRTANLPCVPGRCKCGTARKPCANQVRLIFFLAVIMHRFHLSMETIKVNVLFFRILKLYHKKIYPPVPWRDRDAT